MERFFQILAVILAGVAAYFFWQGDTEKSFISGVFAAVSFFLSVRFQAGKRMRQREAEEEREKGSEGEGDILDSDAPRLNEIPANEQISSEERTTDNEKI